MATVTFRGSRAELRRVLRLLPAILSGNSDDVADLSRGFQLRLSVSLLSQIQQDFLAMSRGGASQWGMIWAPLSPLTIAKRKRTRADVAGFKRAQKLAKKLGKRLRSIDYFGTRQVDILRDTGKLLRSLTPGTTEPPSPAGNPDQVLTLGQGVLIVGTNVPYAEHHQKGTARMPARPIWPQDGTIPDAYWPAIYAAAVRGMLVAYLMLLRGR